MIHKNAQFENPKQKFTFTLITILIRDFHAGCANPSKTMSGFPMCSEAASQNIICGENGFDDRQEWEKGRAARGMRVTHQQVGVFLIRC